MLYRKEHADKVFMRGDIVRQHNKLHMKKKWAYIRDYIKSHYLCYTMKCMLQSLFLTTT